MNLAIIFLILVVIWVIAIVLKRLSPNYIPRWKVMCKNEYNMYYGIRWKRLAYDLIPFWKSVKISKENNPECPTNLPDFELKFKKNPFGRGWIILNYQRFEGKEISTNGSQIEFSINGSPINVNHRVFTDGSFTVKVKGRYEENIKLYFEQ